MPTLWMEKLRLARSHSLCVAELGLVTRWLSPSSHPAYDRGPPEGDGEQL